jgi:hypothetical protein
MRFAVPLSLLCFACSPNGGSTFPSPPAGDQTPPVTPDAGVRDAARATTDAGSGPGPVTGGCSVERITKCPTPKPSYESDVIPILQARCYGCHSSTDGGGPWPLTTLVDIQDWKTQFIQDVESCSMPPVDAGAKLSSDESTTLLGWLVCGAPDN